MARSSGTSWLRFEVIWRATAMDCDKHIDSPCQRHGQETNLGTD